MQHIRKMIIVSATHAGNGHIPSASSIVDVLWVICDGASAAYGEDPDRNKISGVERLIR